MTRLWSVLAVVLAAALVTAGQPLPVVGASVNDSCSKPYWYSRTVPPPSIRVGITGRHDDVSATKVKRIKVVPFKKYVKM